MMVDAGDPQTQRVLTRALARIGAAGRGADLISLHSNAIFAVPEVGLVVRIATNPAAFEAVAASVRVTRWLDAQGFACVPPGEVADQPMVIDGRVVSYWRLLPVVEGHSPTMGDLATLLRDVHGRDGVGDPARRSARITQDPRHADQLLVERVAMSVRLVIIEFLTMIRRHDE